MGKKGVEASISREYINAAAEILLLTSTDAIYYPCVYCFELVSNLPVLKLLSLILLTK